MSEPEMKKQEEAKTPEASSPIQPATKSGSSAMKLPLIFGGIFAFCIVCCCAFFALFGYFYVNEDCVYNGPFSQPPEDNVCFEDKDDKADSTDDKKSDDNAKADSDNSSDDTDNSTDDSDTTGSDVETYEGDGYTFEYSSDLTLSETSKNIFVYLKDPETLDVGEKNPNFNVSSTGIVLGVTKLTKDECADITEEVITSLESNGTYDEVTDSDSMITKINGFNVCKATIAGTSGNNEYYQELYYFVNPDASGYSYPVVISTDGEKEGYDELYDVVKSFMIEE